MEWSKYPTDQWTLSSAICLMVRPPTSGTVSYHLTNYGRSISVSSRKGGAIVLFAQCPFDKILGCSNLAWLKYEWIWEKEKGTGWLNSKFEPMRKHETLLVFSESRTTYNPQMRKGAPYSTRQSSTSSNYGKVRTNIVTSTMGERFPESILHFTRDTQNGLADAIHPTQKPVDLLRYLVKTYSNEGDTILDNCMGSGTTAVACIKEKRHFIGFELNKEYYDKACQRIDAVKRQLTLF